MPAPAGLPARDPPGGDRLLVWHQPGTASALDAWTIAEGRDVGAAGVFLPVLDGRPLHFEREAATFRDVETGSRWDVMGRASGPLAGRRLETVEHVDTFWFAWASWWPGTSLVGGPQTFPVDPGAATASQGSTAAVLWRLAGGATGGS